MAPTKKQEKRDAGNIPPQVFEEWLHAKFTEKQRDTWHHFVTMADAHQGGRSAFIRWLIDQEWERRQQGAHWVGGKGEKGE